MFICCNEWLFSEKKSKYKIDIQLFFQATKWYFIVKSVSNSQMRANNKIIFKIFAILKYELLKGATSFSWNVISPTRCFAETVFYRIVVLPNNDIAERRLTQLSYIQIVKLKKIDNPELYISVSLFSRTSFQDYRYLFSVIWPWHCIKANVVMRPLIWPDEKNKKYQLSISGHWSLKPVETFLR